MEIFNRIGNRYSVEFRFRQEEVDRVFSENKYTKREQKEILDQFDGYTQNIGGAIDHTIELECYIDAIAVFYDERDWQHSIQITGNITDEKCKYLHEKGFWISDYIFEFPDTSFTIHDVSRIKEQIKTKK